MKTIKNHKILVTAQIGKAQYRLAQNDIITIPNIKSNINDYIKLNKIILVENRYGQKQLIVGRPYVDDIIVYGQIIEKTKNKKIKIQKGSPRNNDKKQTQYSDSLVSIKIVKIALSNVLTALLTTEFKNPKVFKKYKSYKLFNKQESIKIDLPKKKQPSTVNFLLTKENLNKLESFSSKVNK